MWKDIIGKTGYKNMQGNKYLYGNMKLLNSEELDAALKDGISVFVKPVPAPETLGAVLRRVKKEKTNLVNSLFETEAVKPILVNGVTFRGGYTTVDRIDGARRLAELKTGNQIQVYDIDDKPVALNPAQVKGLVITLGDNYQNLFAIKQELIVNIREAGNLQAVEDIVIPWVIPEIAV